MGTKLFYATANHELGRFTLAATERGLCALRLPGPGEGVFLRRLVEAMNAEPVHARHLMSHAIAQLEEYLAGSRREFELDLDLAGTPFQTSVWQALTTIPFGQTRTYGQVAGQIGSPSAARAVGVACGRNPIAIIVPCHRVVASGGELGGYSGGLGWKKRLLRLESGAASAHSAA